MKNLAESYPNGWIWEICTLVLSLQKSFNFRRLISLFSAIAVAPMVLVVLSLSALVQWQSNTLNGVLVLELDTVSTIDSLIWLTTMSCVALKHFNRLSCHIIRPHSSMQSNKKNWPKFKAFKMKGSESCLLYSRIHKTKLRFPQTETAMGIAHEMPKEELMLQGLMVWTLTDWFL